VTAEQFQNKELAEFLEDSVHGLFDLNPDYIATVAVNDTAGIASTQYFNCGVEDKARMIHHILTDIIMDIVLSNIELINNAIMELNDEDGEEDDEIE
jgi:hypothetical protein